MRTYSAFVTGFALSVLLSRWLFTKPPSVWLYVRDKASLFKLNLEARYTEVKALRSITKLKEPAGFSASRILWDEEPSVYKLAYNLVLIAPQLFETVCTRQF